MSGSEALPFFPDLLSSVRAESRQDGRGLPFQQAGSLTSPSIFSPSAGSDILSPISVADASSNALLPSVQSPPALVAEPGYFPLFSPQYVAGQSIAGAQEVIGLDQSLTADLPGELPTPPQVRSHGLRLPSFDRLGIANRRPGAPRPSLSGAEIQSLGARFPDSWRDGAVDSGIGSSAPGPSSQHPPGALEPSARPRLPFQPDLLTPPDEQVIFEWHAQSCMSLGDGRRQPGRPSGGSGDASDMSELSSAVESMNVSASETPNEPSPQEEEPPVGTVLNASQLDAVTSAILTTFSNRGFVTYEMKVLSHALPSPRIPGHIYPLVIERIRARLPTSPLTWMSLLHAVPGRYNLSDLPVSPPTTPGQALGGGDDYFTTKIFSGAAVQSADYSSGEDPRPLQSPDSALAAPCTINLCVVERYIPPTSSNEFKNLFSVVRRSLLVDRLVELVPGNGHLLFIYPTKQGGTVFKNSYLQPILMPAMWSMSVINNFSNDLRRSICDQKAVEEMADFETLQRRTVTLCEELSNSNNPQVRRRLFGTDGRFSLVYSRAHNVELDRQVWSDWWVRQEKQRLREDVDRYYRRGTRATASAEITPRSIVQQILVEVGGDMGADGSGKRPRAYAPGSDPAGKKIEVAVFVIRRDAHH